MTDAGEASDVGSLGEEAAKLLGALSGWARDHAGEAGDGIGSLADRAAASVHDLDAHLGTGSEECTVCPLCRTLHAVRRLSPEVTGHLSAAVGSLVQAAAALVATPDPRDADSTRDEVEHIDLADDWPRDDPPATG